MPLNYDYNSASDAIDVLSRDEFIKIDSRLTNRIDSIKCYAANFIGNTSTPSSIEQVKDSIIVAQTYINESSLLEENKKKFLNYIALTEQKISDIIGEEYGEKVNPNKVFTGENTAMKCYTHYNSNQNTYEKSKSENFGVLDKDGVNRGNYIAISEQYLKKDRPFNGPLGEEHFEGEMLYNLNGKAIGIKGDKEGAKSVYNRNLGNNEINYNHAYAIVLQLQLEKMEIGEKIGKNIIASGLVETEKKDDNSFHIYITKGGTYKESIANITTDLENETYKIEKFNDYAFKIWGNKIIEAILQHNGLTFSNNEKNYFSQKFD